MNFNSSEKEIFQAFSDGSVSVSLIKRCIQNGARISEVIEDSTILLELVDFLYENDQIVTDSFLNLLDMGANFSQTKEDGTCILSEVILLHQDKLAKRLLELGANPNVIIECTETLLDQASFDLFYHTNEGSDGDPQHIEWAARMKNIKEELIHHGAKSFNKLWTESLGRWIYLFGYNPTGLVTEGGNIRPCNLPISQGLQNKIISWKRDYWDSWNGEFGQRPSSFEREKNNSEGFEIAKQLRDSIPSLLYVRYAFIEPEGEMKGIRNVHHEVIKAT